MRPLLAVFLAALATVLAPATALADLGDIDPTWGAPANDIDPAGFVLPLRATETSVDDVRDVARGSDGALYLLFTEAGKPKLARMTAAGALDPGWAAGGARPGVATLTDPEAERFLSLESIVVNADGTVFAGGTASGMSFGSSMAVVKVFDNGVQDMTFGGGDGIATYKGQLNHNAGHDIAPFGAGGVVIAGEMDTSTQTGTERRMAAFAFTASGLPDDVFTTYGSDGLGLTDVESNAVSVDVDSGGRVVLAGTGSTVDENGENPVSAWTVARLDPDGTPDLTFDGDGHWQSPRTGGGWEAGNAFAHVVDVVGASIYVGGAIDFKFAVAKLTNLGALDADFDGDGLARPAAGGRDGHLNGVEHLTVDPTGRVYALGRVRRPFATNENGSTAAVVRLQGPSDTPGVEGAPDPLYHGGGGIVFRDTFNYDAFPSGLLLLPDGKLLVAAATFAPYSGGGSGFKFRPTLMRLSETRTAPTNEAAPAINFENGASEGDEVNTNDGIWHTYGGAPAITYAWERCDTAHTATADVDAALDCDTIAGATAFEYTAVVADGEKHLRSVITATNDAGLSSRHASATGPITPLRPESTGQPVVAPTGPVAVGQKIVITNRNFSGGGTLTYTYAWARCDSTGQESENCPLIFGATSDEYTPTEQDVGKFLRARVSASNSGGESLFPNYSKPVAVTAGGDGSGGGVIAPVKTTDPTIDPAGAVTVGDALKATSLGSFSGTPAPTLTRQWERCAGTACDGIPDAQGESYTTTAADVGKVIRLAVYATNAPGNVAKGVSSGREVKAKPVEKKPDPVAAPPKPPAGPANPVRPVNTAHSTKMPSVLGKTADDAVDAIAKAGIFADVTVDAQARRKPLKLNGKALDPGQVHSQSTAGGTSVVSSIGAKHKVRLVVEAGPKGIKACQSAEFRKELKGIDLEESWKLLEEKDCDGRVNLNFKVAGAGDDPEVQSASKDGNELRVTVIVPKNPAEYDLFPEIRQGAVNNNDPQPSFGSDDWALTTGVPNVFGVKTYDRYIAGGGRITGARTVVGAQVYVDGDGVGMEDVVRKSRPDTGDMAIFGRFEPRKAGTVSFLVQAQDAVGNKIFGFGQFKARQRSGKFTTISGETYNVAAGRAVRVARAAGGPVAQAASADQLWRWVSGLFAGGPLQQLGAAAKSASEGLISLAKQGGSAVQFTLGQIASANAQLIRMQGASVVAAGGANVVAAGGANVVSAGGANVVAAGGANAVSAGGANLIGKEKFVSGTGSMRILPDAKLLSDNGLGLISDNGLGLRSSSKLIAPSEGAAIIGTAAGNLIGTAAGNILNQNNAGLIGAAGANIIGQAAGNILNQNNAGLIGQAGGN